MNGVVVIEGKHQLPEGASVVVLVQADARPANKPTTVSFPLVHSKNPGTLDLSGQRISEILDDEEISSGR